MIVPCRGRCKAPGLNGPGAPWLKGIHMTAFLLKILGFLTPYAGPVWRIISSVWGGGKKKGIEEAYKEADETQEKNAELVEKNAALEAEKKAKADEEKGIDEFFREEKY